MVAHLVSCEAADGQRLRATLVGVRPTRLGDVREDADKAGLWYARVPLAAGAAGRASERRSSGCVVC